MLPSCFITYCLLGVESARLVSQKAKGMPRIVVTLTKMAESSASEAMATLSLELFRSFKRKQHLQGIYIYILYLNSDVPAVRPETDLQMINLKNKDDSYFAM